MLVDKYDSQVQEALISPRVNHTQQDGSGKKEPRKLPNISKGRSHYHNISLNHFVSPKNQRIQILTNQQDKPSLNQDENIGIRGPRVYNKNLPDVFIPNTPSTKRLKKLTTAYEQKRKDSSNETKPPRINASAQQHREGSNSFASPIRLVQINAPKKRKIQLNLNEVNHTVIENLYGPAPRTNDTPTNFARPAVTCESPTNDISSLLLQNQNQSSSNGGPFTPKNDGVQLLRPMTRIRDYKTNNRMKVSVKSNQLLKATPVKGRSESSLHGLQGFQQHNQAMLVQEPVANPATSIQNQHSKQISADSSQQEFRVRKIRENSGAIDPVQSEEKNSGGAGAGSSKDNSNSKESELNKQIKKLIVFKKMISKSPDTKFDVSQQNSANKNVKIISKEQIKSMILQLNELITLKKIKTTLRNGILKRMIYAPSFKIYDIQEEPIAQLKSRETVGLKDWVNSWKANYMKSKNLCKIYSCFWNSPEGCVSILLEPAKKGFLNDLLNNYGTLPEKAIQPIARDLLFGLLEIHERGQVSHGSITTSEIMFGENGEAKIAPSISYHANKKDIQPLKKFAANSGSSSVDEGYNRSGAAFSSVSQQLIANDIFDLGLVLLQCAVGDLSLFDINTDQIKPTLEMLQQKRANLSQRSAGNCCLIHNPEVLKRTLIGVVTSHSNSKGLTRRKILTNNFSYLSPRSSETKSSQNTPHADNSLLTLKKFLGQTQTFSESFLDFLCCCLRFDQDQRFTARSLIGHEFLSDNHKCSGPVVSLSDILRLQMAKQSDLGLVRDITSTLGHSHVEKLCEALHMVLMNKDVRRKFESYKSKSPYNQKYNDPRIKSVANELGVTAKVLWDFVEPQISMQNNTEEDYDGD